MRESREETKESVWDRERMRLVGNSGTAGIAPHHRRTTVPRARRSLTLIAPGGIVATGGLPTARAAGAMSLSVCDYRRHLRRLTPLASGRFGRAVPGRSSRPGPQRTQRAPEGAHPCEANPRPRTLPGSLRAALLAAVPAQAQTTNTIWSSSVQLTGHKDEGSIPGYGPNHANSILLRDEFVYDHTTFRVTEFYSLKNQDRLYIKLRATNAVPPLLTPSTGTNSAWYKKTRNWTLHIGSDTVSFSTQEHTEVAIYSGLSIDPGNDGGDEYDTTVKGLTNGTQYAFELRAVNGAGAGQKTGPVTATPVLPATPELLSADWPGTTLILTYDRPLNSGTGLAASDFETNMGTIPSKYTQPTAPSITNVDVSGSRVVLTMNASYPEVDGYEFQISVKLKFNYNKLQAQNGTQADSSCGQAHIPIPRVSRCLARVLTS